MRRALVCRTQRKADAVVGLLGLHDWEPYALGAAITGRRFDQVVILIGERPTPGELEDINVRWATKLQPGEQVSVI